MHWPLGLRPLKTRQILNSAVLRLLVISFWFLAHNGVDSVMITVSELLLINTVFEVIEAPSLKEHLPLPSLGEKKLKNTGIQPHVQDIAYLSKVDPYHYDSCYSLIEISVSMLKYDVQKSLLPQKYIPESGNS